MLELLLMLDVRVAQACRGMVPITNGNERDKFNPPGTSTYTTRAYSTRMMGQSKIEGDTGGILSSLPSQL